MKNRIVLMVFLFSFCAIHAQKVKIKKGKVYVDKKEYLTVESSKKGDVYSSLEGKVLFILKKESIEKENANQINVQATATGTDIEKKLNQVNGSSSDPLRRGNRYAKPKKINFIKVSFFTFDLQYETTLKDSKILKEFYNAEILNIAGVIDQVKAKRVAAKMRKEISKKK
tara:strand:+ start:2613 stop:3122 length:510 start_codon:yes stop_codon:yes gene_type:complete